MTHEEEYENCAALRHPGLPVLRRRLADDGWEPSVSRRAVLADGRRCGDPAVAVEPGHGLGFSWDHPVRHRFIRGKDVHQGREASQSLSLAQHLRSDTLDRPAPVLRHDPDAVRLDAQKRLRSGGTARLRGAVPPALLAGAGERRRDAAGVPVLVLAAGQRKDSFPQMDGLHQRPGDLCRAEGCLPVAAGERLPPGLHQWADERKHDPLVWNHAGLAEPETAMNWPRIILDGLSMSLLFNAVAGLGFLLVPQAYSTMFPKEIRQAAAPFVEKKDVRTMKLILYPLYLVLFVYLAISAHFAGMIGFWNLFWVGYVEMTMVSISDFIVLDCWLPPKAKPFIKGAEHCKAWERMEWLKTLAIPEHGLLWTLIVCPIAGLAVAGLNMLF